MLAVTGSSVAVEHELRYLRPSKFRVPQILCGLELLSSNRGVHRDHYFDGICDGKPALRSKRCSLRVRYGADGRIVATFKQRAAKIDGVPGTARLETESVLAGPAFSAELIDLSVNTAGELALAAARDAAGEGVQLVELFKVTNDRRNHHYTGPDGQHLILSEDHIIYPDGSTQRRVEVEVAGGDPSMLADADRQLRARYGKLREAPRGKASEARRRLAALLAI